MGKYFDETMAEHEARAKLYELLESGQEDEEEVKKEYRGYVKMDVARRMKLVDEGWIF